MRAVVGSKTCIGPREMIDERAMGALMMQFMLETIILGDMLEVDPFGQPAVELGKKLTRDYLEKT